MKNYGFWISQLLIVAALITSLFLDPLDMYWQIGFASSLSLSIATLFLTRLEALDDDIAIVNEFSSEAKQIDEILKKTNALQAVIEDKNVYLAIAREELLHLQSQQKNWAEAVFAEKRKFAQLKR